MFSLGPIGAGANRRSPLLAAYFEHRFSKVFTRDEVRERVIPAYMGLITQIDDQIGRLMAWMAKTGYRKIH